SAVERPRCDPGHCASRVFDACYCPTPNIPKIDRLPHGELSGAVGCGKSASPRWVCGYLRADPPRPSRIYQFDQFERPHAIRLPNPDPPAKMLLSCFSNGNRYSDSSPLTTPITRGSVFHHPQIGPPELPGLMSAVSLSSSWPSSESPSSSRIEIPPCHEGR